MIPERLAALRQEMEKRDIAVYIVPTADFHESEYVGEYFKARRFITGFTGSAGTAVITRTKAGLWTDGRYFVQAAKQLEGTTVTLYRMGEEHVPTVDEYVEQTLKEGGTIGFDGRVVNGRWGAKLQQIAEKKHGKLYVQEDLIGQIWKDRPPMSKEPVWILDEAYSGRSTKDKLAAVREKMKEKGAEVHLLASLYDIAWLLNVRGNDISYVPVVLSYLALTQEQCIWFLQEEVVDDTLREYLQKNGITTRPYEAFYEYVKDAVAMCRFMYWLKKNVGKIPMTEISASDYLESLRREQEGLLDLSFDTICGYADHGAIVHYAATPESDVPLKPEGLLLVDSGGHYLEGTTDITRTFALGPVTEEMKADFTRVCRSNMNLANARFLYGCSGMNLDIIAREPFWEAGLDFKHGTGHGVGYVLNVHEGPNAFRYKGTEDRPGGAVFEEGMVTTDEPGIYIEGKYGIRLENELVCQKGEKNEYGQFMYFENLTYVPFDLDAIDPKQMTEVEKKRLNDYHANVYKVVSPYLQGEELAWLKEATRAI